MKKIVFGFIILFSLGASGQFSGNPTQFVKDIDKYLSASNRTKTKEFIEVFEPNWLNNFSTEYQSKVIATSNLIVAKRLPPFPELYGYLLSVHSFVETNQPQESFDSWHQTIDKLLDSKKVKSFRDFIEICANFFTDGTIYYSTNHIWKANGGKYIFEFDKNSPNIIFEETNLQCYIVNRQAGKKENPYLDSTIVRVTNGVYEPLINKWTGRGGVVDWQKVGLDKSKNYAEITDYMMSLKSTKVESDSAKVFTDYYETPLYGKFSDMAKKINREVDRVNPQFMSFSKKIVKKDILPEVDYVGGFAIEGADFKGVGFDSEPANVVFYKDGKAFVKASSLRFTVNNKKITSSECEITLYLNEKDSIYHPGIEISYDLNSLDIARGNEGISQAPFSNSFHQLDMYVDRIIWTKNDPNLNFTWHPQSSRKIARFESQDFFNARVYNDIQGMNSVNPLVSIYQYAYKYDLDIIPINQVSGGMGLTNEQAIPILLGLANQGFINYNKVKQTITIQPKLKKYIDARAGRSDYDNIVFTSNLLEVKKKPETNADGSPDRSAESYNRKVDELNKRKSLANNFGNLNISSLDFSLNEIDPIEISQAQNVIVLPKDGEVLIKENRGFLFGGPVIAGKMEVYVEEGAFDYENFKIFLMAVDAALLRVEPIFGGSDRLIPMQSNFSKLKGSILVDDVSNRSGKNEKDFTEYPILKTTEDCFVYYNHPSIYEGVYDSSDFYFKVEPFEFDSLDNYDEYAVSFKGELRSAGIFPVFKENIVIQEDYSFGFETKAPPAGFNFYGEDAKFENEIRLSNEGLRGAGEINFITSNSVSENFIFFPDSTMGLAQYVNKPQTKSQGVAYPDVSGKDVIVTYVPKEKVLKARFAKNPLLFFDQEAELKGSTELRADGMTGRGLMYFKDAELGSKAFKFSRWAIDADTSDFNLLGAEAQEDIEGGENPLAFNSVNLNAHVDFESRKGEFKSNDGTSVVEFPKNEYICYIDVFTWLMDKDEMELSTSGNSDVTIESDLDLAGSNFYSVHKDQDSLNFAAPKARFMLKENVIYCEEVKYLDIADARIIPVDQKVNIRKKAKMDAFDNAEIIANFITKYHKITEAHVEVTARRKYTANGKYPYVDSKKQTQIIFFENITLDSAYQTVATGEIKENANFSLSDKFDFYGTAELRAADPFLTFDGATRINHECNQFARNWLKFRAEINPEDIQIPVSQSMNDLDGNSIAVGLIKRKTSNSDSLAIYPAFLSSLEREDDAVLFTSYGVLNYNEEAKEFRIASPEKLINRAEKGNYISLHIESCSMEGDGLVNLDLNLPSVEAKTYGVVNYDMATKRTSINLSGGISFFFDKKAMEMISTAIKGQESLTGIDFGRTTLEQAVSEEISREEAEDLKADYTLDGEVKKLPKELNQMIYFTNMRMHWDDRALGFVSEPISGIVGLDGVPLFKDFTVRMAIEYVVEGGDRGTKLGYLIELPGGEKPGDYYFFRFERVKKNTVLNLISSDKALQAYILEMKEDKKKEKDLSYDIRVSGAANYLGSFTTFWGE